MGDLYFDCPYGIFSVSENGLYSADKWTWNEIPDKWLNDSIATAESGQFLLHCGGGPDDVKRYEESIFKGEIEKVDSLPNFDLYKFK